jgi:hypothetical protein
MSLDDFGFVGHRAGGSQFHAGAGPTPESEIRGYGLVGFGRYRGAATRGLATLPPAPPLNALARPGTATPPALPRHLETRQREKSRRVSQPHRNSVNRGCRPAIGDPGKRSTASPAPDNAIRSVSNRYRCGKGDGRVQGTIGNESLLPTVPECIRSHLRRCHRTSAQAPPIRTTPAATSRHPAWVAS